MNCLAAVFARKPYMRGRLQHSSAIVIPKRHTMLTVAVLYSARSVRPVRGYISVLLGSWWPNSSSKQSQL